MKIIKLFSPKIACVLMLSNAYVTAMAQNVSVEAGGNAKEVKISIENKINQSCGIEVDFGDGKVERIRSEAGKVNGGQYTYGSDGDYKITIKGAVIFRGLGTVFPCNTESKFILKVDGERVIFGEPVKNIESTNVTSVAMKNVDLEKISSQIPDSLKRNNEFIVGVSDELKRLASNIRAYGDFGKIGNLSQETIDSLRTQSGKGDARVKAAIAYLLEKKFSQGISELLRLVEEEERIDAAVALSAIEIIERKLLINNEYLPAIIIERGVAAGDSVAMYMKSRSFSENSDQRERLISNAAKGGHLLSIVEDAWRLKNFGVIDFAIRNDESLENRQFLNNKRSTFMNDLSKWQKLNDANVARAVESARVKKVDAIRANKSYKVLANCDIRFGAFEAKRQARILIDWFSLGNIPTINAYLKSPQAACRLFSADGRLDSMKIDPDKFEFISSRNGIAYAVVDRNSEFLAVSSGY